MDRTLIIAPHFSQITFSWSSLGLMAVVSKDLVFLARRRLRWIDLLQSPHILGAPRDNARKADIFLRFPHSGHLPIRRTPGGRLVDFGAGLPTGAGKSFLGLLVGMAGYSRTQGQTQSPREMGEMGLQWGSPSPNIPHPSIRGLEPFCRTAPPSHRMLALGKPGGLRAI